MAGTVKPEQQESTSTGTGIIIGQNDSELLIVTNNHVVEGAINLSVVFSADEGKDGSNAVERRSRERMRPRTSALSP